jgi:predicted nucleic acid-binding protein
MILVVADSSPIGYLIRIGEIELLSNLYEQVILPTAVLRELQAADGLPAIRDWAQELPLWALVQSPLRRLPELRPNLHLGESEAIALAEEMRAGLLLIDDRVGVRVALERGLTITGTLGILVEAAQVGLVDIEQVLARLKETNFRATPALFERALELARLDPPVPPRRSRA